MASTTPEGGSIETAAALGPGAGAVAAPASRRTGHYSKSRKQRLVQILFILPAVIYMLAFFGYPVIKNFVMGFQDYTTTTFYTGEAPWVGLDNYADVVRSPVFMQAAINTVIFTVGSIVGQLIIGMILALYFQKKFPGSGGPYTMNASETTIGTSWVFDRRDDYWGDKLPFKRVVISVFDNENAMVNGLKTGQLNSVLLQTADQQAAAKSDANLTSQDTSFDFQGILIFDRGGKLNPALGDARVRQALNYAVDRDALVKGIRQGRGTATSQVFGTTTKGYEAKLDTYYSYDPAKAKALLAEAGYANGLTVTLPNLPTISTDNIRTALTSQMAEAGIKLEWAESANPLQGIFRQFKFSGMVMNMGQSSNDWNYVQTYIQPGTFNFFANTDPVLTEQAAKLQKSTGAEYEAAAKAINERFVEQGWFIPFYRMTYSLVSDKTVTVVPQDGMAVPSLYNYTPAS